MPIRGQQNDYELSGDLRIGPLPVDRALLTSRETAHILKISPRTLAYWTAGRRPRLCYVKLGKAKRFVIADVLRFIEEHKVRVA